MSYGAILNQTFPSAMLPQLIVSTLVPMSSVTATVNEVVYQGTLTNDKWYIDVEGLGACVINGTKADGSGTEQTSLNINYVGQYEVMLGTLDPVLNNNSWAAIRYAADNNMGSSVWSVGDAKQITLNGTVGILTLDNYQPYVYILGFNHNADLEGNNLIHFGFGTTALNGGTNIALVDSLFATSSAQVSFHMNSSPINNGGWKDSFIRNNICGINLDNISQTILSIISNDLFSVLSSVTKYTNNVIGSTDSGLISSTTDYFFLLSEFEVFGNITYANTYEADYQKQYQYYINGNTKTKYQYNSLTESRTWWLRSPYAFSTIQFVTVIPGEQVNYGNAQTSLGFAPAFCV